MDRYELEEIISEVISDIKYARSKSNESDPYRNMRFGRANSFAGISAFFPQLMGILLGCAISKMLGFGTLGYLILGLIFAVIAGTVKSFLIDDIPFKRSIIKNLIMLVFTLLIFGIPFLMLTLMFTT